MTSFNIESISDLPDRIYVEIDHRFNVAIIRTEFGIDLRVYPRTDGELWDFPFARFEVDESEIVAIEPKTES